MKGVDRGMPGWAWRAIAIGGLAYALATLGYWANLVQTPSSILFVQGSSPPHVVESGHGSWQLLHYAALYALPVALLTGLAAMLRRLLACITFFIVWAFVGRLMVTTIVEIDIGAFDDLLFAYSWNRGLGLACAFVGAAVIFIAMDRNLDPSD